jgi:hypothetical protein
MKTLNQILQIAAVTAAISVVVGCSTPRIYDSGSIDRDLGAFSNLGQGTVSSYSEIDDDGNPTAIGITFSAESLNNLPSGSDGHHCFDKNNDGAMDKHDECLHGHEFVIPLPDSVTRNSDIPFKWVLLNWNPEGHIPPEIYDLPHFDIHFVIEPIENIYSIESGPCGPEFVRCDQFEIARKPLPSNYMHADFQDVEAVVPAMGNHLVDLTSPEFQGEVFTHTWIYGVYDARITFYEEMVTREYLLSKVQQCTEIKTPPAVGLEGYYPTLSCIRYRGNSDEYTVSMEGFEFREASNPAPAS